jgi:hypothetical protein
MGCFVGRQNHLSRFMITHDQIKIFLSMFLMELPMLIVSLVASFVILIKWKQAARGSLWALLGFGLLLVLCIAMPIVQTILQSWLFQSGQRAGRLLWVLSTFSIIWSMLYAASYVFLLIAIFAGRSTPNPTNPSSYTSQ